MKSLIRFALLSAVTGIVSFAAASARADDAQIRHYFFGNNDAWGSAYSSGRIPTPPYFAIHPPVYYSYPVPRTYGYTPWAYPSYVMTPEIKAPVKPAMFENPHVEQDKAPAKSASQHSGSAVQPASVTSPAPQIMINPFVEQTNVRTASVTVR